MYVSLNCVFLQLSLVESLYYIPIDSLQHDLFSTNVQRTSCQ